MLEQISWTDFALCLGGGCIAYYGVLLVTGKMSLKPNREPTVSGVNTEGASRKRKWKPEQQDQDDDEENEVSHQKADTSEKEGHHGKEDQEFTALEMLADELQVIITQCGVENTSKEELLEKLRREIVRYPTLNKPAFQGAVSNLIIKSAQQECSMDISRQEAIDLWTNL